MKIVVLAGGLSPERNVSLSTGAMVMEGLKNRGHQVVMVDMFFGLESFEGTVEDYFATSTQASAKVDPVAPDLEKIMATRKVASDSLFGDRVIELCQMADVVFLALHGACGEDGRVQATFDLMGIPYTGAGFLPSAIAMDKDLTKRTVAHLVNTPSWETVAYQEGDIEAMVACAKLPLVVKPVDSGSSIGVSIVHTSEEYRIALIEGLTLGGRTVLETYIKGREIQVGVLGDTALPSIEIIPKEGFYDYANKYQPNAAIEVCPAEIPQEVEQAIQEATLRVYHGLGLCVYARADFILDDQGKLWFLEINTLPGMTPTSLLPQEAAAVGISYDDLCQHIVDGSIRARKLGK